MQRTSCQNFKVSIEKEARISLAAAEEDSLLQFGVRRRDQITFQRSVRTGTEGKFVHLEWARRYISELHSPRMFYHMISQVQETYLFDWPIVSLQA